MNEGEFERVFDTPMTSPRAVGQLQTALLRRRRRSYPQFGRSTVAESRLQRMSQNCDRLELTNREVFASLSFVGGSARC